jgi:ribosomal protein S18 acetylase RimI-like enzyme
MLSQPDLLALADANLAEFAREHARWLPPTRIEEHTDLLLAAAGTRFPAGPWNCMMPLATGPSDPQAALAIAQAFFAREQRGFCVYARSHRDASLVELCLGQGCPRISDSPGMVLTQPLASTTLAPGISVRNVHNDDDAQAFVQVMATAYESLQLPAAITYKLLSQPARWLSAHCQAFVVCEGERAQAGALLLFSHGIAGVYWVATVPDARRRGHAETVMRAVSNRAFECGARAVILQASSFGEPLYRRLGYREFTRYASYLMPSGKS